VSARRHSASSLPTLGTVCRRAFFCRHGLCRAPQAPDATRTAHTRRDAIDEHTRAAAHAPPPRSGQGRRASPSLKTARGGHAPGSAGWRQSPGALSACPASLAGTCPPAGAVKAAGARQGWGRASGRTGRTQRGMAAAPARAARARVYVRSLRTASRRGERREAGHGSGGESFCATAAFLFFTLALLSSAMSFTYTGGWPPY
jgi:hypothetical protein